MRVLHEAAPALSRLDLSMQIERFYHQHARAVLRKEPPYQAVRIRRLNMVERLDATAVVAFCSDFRCHVSLEELRIDGISLDTAAAMGAFVDACIVLRLRKLKIDNCRVATAALPELTRLVSAGALRDLGVRCCGEIFDKTRESTRLFVAAVRASAMTRLQLVGMGVLPDMVVRAAAAFINARSQ